MKTAVLPAFIVLVLLLSGCMFQNPSVKEPGEEGGIISTPATSDIENNVILPDPNDYLETENYPDTYSSLVSFSDNSITLPLDDSLPVTLPLIAISTSFNPAIQVGTGVFEISIDTDQKKITIYDEYGESVIASADYIPGIVSEKSVLFPVGDANVPVAFNFLVRENPGTAVFLLSTQSIDFGLGKVSFLGSGSQGSAEYGYFFPPVIFGKQGIDSYFEVKKQDSQEKAIVVFDNLENRPKLSGEMNFILLGGKETPLVQGNNKLSGNMVALAYINRVDIVISEGG